MTGEKGRRLRERPISGAPLLGCPSQGRRRKRYAPPRCCNRYAFSARLWRRRVWPPVAAANELQVPRLLCRCHLPPRELGGEPPAPLCSRHGQSVQPAVDRSAQRLMKRRRWAAPAAGWAARHLLIMRARHPQTLAISLRSWRYAQPRARASAAQPSRLPCAARGAGAPVRPPGGSRKGKTPARPGGMTV